MDNTIPAEDNVKPLKHNALKVYFEAEKQGKKIGDIVLMDDNMVTELGEMWITHENAIKTLIQVINADTVKFMVETAIPEELLPLRHELYGAEKIPLYLAKYAGEYQRRKKRVDTNKPEKEEEEEKATEELENTSPPAPVKEGEESSL